MAYRRSTAIRKRDDALLQPGVLYPQVGKQTIQEIFDVWPGLLPELPTPPDFAKKLIERWDRLTLVKETRPAMVQGQIDEDDQVAAAKTPR